MEAGTLQDSIAECHGNMRTVAPAGLRAHCHACGMHTSPATLLWRSYLPVLRHCTACKSRSLMPLPTTCGWQ